MIILFRVFLLNFFLIFPHFGLGEPWLSNRYAQNCAGCHAPGRLNRPPAKRRCTLSCQGCHVNPNGGGLRNRYGKWNEERWLRSFYSDITWNKKSTALLKDQHYAFKKRKASQKRKERGTKKERRKKKSYAKYGAPLVTLKGIVKDERPYFESSNYITAKNKKEEMIRIPREDPYRLEKTNPVTVGGDLRFFYIQQSEGARPGSKLEKGVFFPMVFDFGVRVRPLKKKLSFVYEGRIVNRGQLGPNSNISSLDSLFGPRGSGINRSAYLLVDDLAYNSYFQLGFTRPMFGLYSANHNAMISDYTGLGFSTSLKMIGFGLAPNVPFAIFNYILPATGVQSGMSAEKGFQLTGGLRFVRYGAHLVAHYWRTERSQGNLPFKRSLWNINGGLVLLNRRLILNGELTHVGLEYEGADIGKILGLETRFRIWREAYVKASFTQANVAVDYDLSYQSQTGLSPGSGQEIQYGFRGFWLSGFETEVLVANKLIKEEGSEDYKENTMTFQMHAYF